MNTRTRFIETCICSLLLVTLLSVLAVPFQSVANAQTQTDNQPAVPSQSGPDLFRVERMQIEGGAELLTIRAKLDQESADPDRQWMPLVSVLRDTLGDAQPENDRLRYIWSLTYTRPTVWQRVSGAVPFLYTHVGNKQSASRQPPPLMDLAAADHEVWNKIWWVSMQGMLLDPYGVAVRASTRSYQKNISDFRKSHVVQALSLLALYQALGHERIFNDAELKEIQARLILTDKTFGGLVDELKLPRFYQKENARVKDNRGHNWELLRQQAEANGLYFEPLEMPDGSATHALLWIAKADLGTRSEDRYNGRFLNIANPWTDKRLLDWHGYSETRSFDGEHRPAGDGEEANEVEMIPLALYGLDHPKIPALLVDFRDTHNPKRREMSRRVLEDVTKNVLALSRFGDLPYFVGRSVFDFVTGRRGMDINQPSRLKTYAQLKLLLSLNESLDPDLRSEITNRLEIVSLNPLENSVEAERKLAQQQYQALVDYAKRPDGLAAKLAQDRRVEMTRLEHDKPAQIFFRLANVLSFGKYVHRESDSPNITARLDLARQRAFHTLFLREVAQSGASQIDTVWSLDEVKRSLRFMAEHGSPSDAKAVRPMARIFVRTNDDETRRACLAALSQINNNKARAELVRISELKGLDQSWRDLSTQYLSASGRVSDQTSVSGTSPGNPDRH